MDSTDHPAANEHIIRSWYAYAAEQPGSVGSWLRLVRERTGQSPSDQQRGLQATDDQFLRLCGMRLPRPDRFTDDAQRIALACDIGNPFAFTRAMLMARGIQNQSASTNTNTNVNTRTTERQEQYYMAAFDTEDDLNTLPDSDPDADYRPLESEPRGDGES